MSPTHASPTRLLLVMRRLALASFFRSLPAIAVEVVRQDLAGGALEGADVVAVDVALEPDSALELCASLHRGRPSLPLVAIVCCPQSVTPWQLERLLEGGVGSVLDLQASADEAARTLEAAADGGSVFHLHLRRGHRRVLQGMLAGRDSRRETNVRALELVARGLSDREIGAVLHLSPHTIKHHVEHLRAEVGARNRTELAAWAGRHGFYRPEADDLVSVQLER